MIKIFHSCKRMKYMHFFFKLYNKPFLHAFYCYAKFHLSHKSNLVDILAKIYKIIKYIHIIEFQTFPGIFENLICFVRSLIHTKRPREGSFSRLKLSNKNTAMYRKCH